MKISRAAEVLKDSFQEFKRAYLFANTAHRAKNQKVPYTGQDYIAHPLAVAFVVMDYTTDIDVLQACLLHDVVEDTHITRQDIEVNFGQTVAEYVSWVTKVSRPQDGNRAQRVAIDIEHMAKAPPNAKTIKLGDILVNTSTIVDRDPPRAETYLSEKRLALAVLKDGDPRLWQKVSDVISHEIERLTEILHPTSQEAQHQ